MQSEDDSEVISDAPPHVLRGDAANQVQGDETFVGKTVTVGRPRQEFYAIWKDFTRFRRIHGKRAQSNGSMPTDSNG